MANQISINEKNLKELFDAFGHYFPSDTVYVADKPFKSFYGNYTWKNRGEFIEFLRRLTSVGIRNENDTANIKLAQDKLVGLVGTEASEEKPIEANTPDKWAREAQEIERQKREDDIKISKEKGEREVQDSIKRKQEFFRKQKLYEKYREALANKKVTVVPKGGFTQVPLTPAEKEIIYKLAQDPNISQVAIEQKIREAVSKSTEDVKQNISESVIKHTATDFISKVKTFSDYKDPKEIPDTVITYNSASPIVSITDINNEKLKEIVPDEEARAALVENAKAVAATIDAENTVNSALISPIFEDSPEITQLFYPKNIAQFEIAEDQDRKESKDEGIDIDLRDVYDNGRDVWDLWQKLSTNEFSVDEVIFESYSIVTPPAITAGTVSVAETSGLILSTLPSTVGAIVGLQAGTFSRQMFIQGVPMIEASNTVFPMLTSGGTQSLVTMATPSIARFSGTFFINSAGIGAISSSGNLGFFAGQKIVAGGTKIFAAGIKLGQSSLVAAAGGTGVKVVATGAFAKIGAALGSFAPVVGNIVGAVVGFLFGKILEKIPWDKIKAFFKDYGGPIGIGLIAGGALLGSVPMVAVGAPLLIGGVSAAGGPAGFFSNLAGLTGVLLTAFVFRAGKAIAITLITIPIVVAILLLIINSGAYVTPPNIGTGAYYGEHDCSEGIRIVERAEAINRNLQLGFNAYYNKSPDYPQLWNAELFATNPNPEVQTAVIGSDDMFWCNYTPYEAYKAVNQNIPFGLTAMMNYFINQNKWTSGEVATTEGICPGDTIFFRTPAGASYLSHVAVVSSVTEDEIITVQSNSPWKHNDYSTDATGRFPIYGSGDGTIEIVGFGAP